MERKIKNSILQIEVGQWYNLTICQEEINGKKFQFTATVTELPDEGDTETEGEFKIVFLLGLFLLCASLKITFKQYVCF